MIALVTVSKMIYNMSRVTLNPTHLLIHFRFFLVIVDLHDKKLSSCGLVVW